MTIAADDMRLAKGIGAGVVPLLAIAIFINYVDRGNLATAASLIKDQMGLSSTQLGFLISAFFWSYTPSMLLAGWLIGQINAYRTLTLGLALWAIATVVSGFVTSFAAFVAMRLLLGIGESAAFPCSSKLLAEHLPAHKRGGANGLIAVGLALGPAFGTFTGGLLMAQYGWRAVFVVFGLASLLWLWPWLAVTREASLHADSAPRQSSPGYLDIVRVREAWGASLGHFAANYTFYFVISWLPLYLIKVRGFSVSGMAELGGLIYLVYAASSLSCGWMSDRWMAAGASDNRVRKSCMVFSHLSVATAMAGCATGNTIVAVASLFLAAIAFGFGTPTIYAIGQTLAGSRAAGKWVGLQNGLGNFAGIVAPIVTGYVIDRTGEFFWAFVVAGIVSLVGVAAWGLVIRRVAPVEWAFAD